MANISTPFGLRSFGVLEGSPPTYGTSTRKIASGNGTAIGRGDLLVTLATGYVTVYTAASALPCAGVFQGCEYLSVSQKIKVRSPFWPGSDANGDVLVFVIDDPRATFIGQSSGAPIVQNNGVGMNVDIVAGSGVNTTTGYSGQQLNATPAVTATLPLRVLRLASDVLAAGSNGSDNTTNFNMVILGFNNIEGKPGTLGI